MTAFMVGMKVVCVDDDFSSFRHYPEINPVKGDVYTVREVRGPAILFLEIENQKHWYRGYDEGLIFIEKGFKADRFRPIASRPTSIAVFQAMLTGKKAGVEA